MNIEIIPNIINSVGLFFDIIGAWFVAIEVVFQYKGKTHHEPTIYANGTVEQDETPEYTKDKKIKHKAMWFGLFLLTAGFALQIFSNCLQMDMNKYKVRPEITSPKQINHKQQVGNNQLH